MNGNQYLTDEKGRKVAVQIDLKKHRELWEEIEDVLVSRSRRDEKRIPLEKVKARLESAVRRGYRSDPSTDRRRSARWH